MTDRPIIFSAPMVNALLAGRKSQTRRIPKPSVAAKLEQAGDKLLQRFPRQKGTGWEIGDDLWVKEATTRSGALMQYCADHATTRLMWPDHWTRDPQGSRFMPRHFSRLTLTVTDARVQRVQEISVEDADAEVFGGDFPHQVMPELFGNPEASSLSIPECFGRLWNSLHGVGAWEANPFVVAITFTVDRRNIDAPA